MMGIPHERQHQQSLSLDLLSIEYYMVPGVGLEERHGLN